MSNSTFWKNLTVYNTLILTDLRNVKSTCDIILNDFLKLEKSNNFSYRILLPRNDENNKLAKQIGFSLQLELFSQLRKQKIKTYLKEIKYVHDQNHFGWLLISSHLYQKMNLPNY
jgi:hypothetical protein